jgi:hypothetical protein
MQLLRRAFSRAAASAGSNIPARMAMIAITTSNSINVNADNNFLHIFSILRMALLLARKPKTLRTLASTTPSLAHSPSY